ncbi:MAG: PEFG-CTERM sorting domain-containing protein [Nitrosarchaeum sp.]|nr:PEFG-CTERM sorting domain-containing protein [Nitrosarchaeum sp.]
MISFLFFNNFSKVSSKFLNIRILFLLSIVVFASFSSNLVFAQHDHGSSSSGSESGGAGSFAGLEGYQAMVELSEIGNCYGCNNNTNNQVLTIFKHGTADMPFLAGGTMFMISPNPYAFTNFNGSANPQFFGPTLIVSDNDPLDYDPTRGVIELIKVNPGVYSIWELRGPQGFIKNNAPHSSAEVAVGNYPLVPVTNLFLNSSSGPQTMLPPPLPTSNLNTMNTYAPKVGNQPLTQLPSSIVSSKNTVMSTPAPPPIVFGTPLPPNTWTTEERFSNLGIPTYDPPPSGDSNSGYIPPKFVATNIDGSRIISTPKFSSIDFNTNLVLRLDGITQHDNHHGTHGPSVLGINLPLAVAGNDFGVSLQIKDTPPSTFPNLDPANGFEALFIDLSVVGDIDLNNSNSFSENPTITFYLDKNSGSCVDPSTVTIYLLNGNQWNPVQVSGHVHPSTLVPSLHTTTQCAYEQEVEHFSSYLVGTGSASSGHGGHGSGHSHSSADHANHADHNSIISYTIDDCTVNGLIRDIYNNQVYLQIHTDSDGNITTNSGPGDFYTPGEARGQLNYQYGSKVFSTLAKPSNEILDTEQDTILWAKSRATATASFESTSFNEIQYTISTKNLPNIVGISLYLGDQYTNSEIRLIDIPYTANPFKPNSDTITGKLTNDNMCKISHEEHGFASHDDHTMTDDETVHDGHTMDEEGIISHDDHVMDQATSKDEIISHDQHSSHNESNTCYGVSCVDPEPKEFLVALVDGSFDSSYDFGNISGKKILASTHYKTFPITYDLNGELKKMTVNEEENTLSLYFDNVIEDKLTLRLPRALVDAENNNFLVMVTASPERMVDYEIISYDESFFTMQLDVPSNASQVSIIGTRVIPEFGTMVMMMLTVSIISIIAVTRKTKISM